ncbi:MAG: hypothetical protein MUF51_02585 [Vicinamibacteria bacterium]|jgi:hypothetical protein|nr:hypothetical protein [Vicinamibacteria bacterium]
MNAVKVDVTVDDVLARALPSLRPLLGRRVELIAIEAEASSKQAMRPRLSFDDFLARCPERPKGVQPVTIEDMDQAIIKEALDGNA